MSKGGASSSLKGVVEKYTGSKTSVDWTDKYTTAIKDQGNQIVGSV